MALLEIRESRIERVKVLEDTGDGVFRFEAVVSEADYINQNRRMYPARVLFPAFDAVNAEIDRHPGTVDHPDPYGSVSVSDLGISWENFRYEGSQVIGQGRIIPTAKGRDLQAAMEAGVAVGFSTRGRGMSEEQTIDGRTVSVLTDYKLDTVDAVVDPSVGHARIRSFTKEEKEKMDEELKAANEAKAAAESRVAELEGQLAEANSKNEALLNAHGARVAEIETAHEGRVNELEGRIAELESLVAERAEDALEAKLVSLTSGHRFAATIIAQAKELSVTIESAEKIVSVLTGLVEGAASAANETVEGDPRGDVSTNEDAEIEDEVSEEKHQELVDAGLALPRKK